MRKLRTKVQAIFPAFSSSFWDKTHISGRFQTPPYPPTFGGKMKRVFLRKSTYLHEEKSNLKTVENLNTCDHPTHHSKKKQYLHTSGTSCFFRFWSVHEKNWFSFWGVWHELHKVSNIHILTIFSIENIFLEQKTSFETKKLGLKNEFKFFWHFQKNPWC